MKYKLQPERIPKNLLSIPFIGSMIIPLVILDVFLEMYHHVSFPLYGMPLVERGKYIRVDRQKLHYLGFWSRIFCMYCGYANGLIHYASVVAAKTEEYWCGIKHEARDGFVAPAHHEEFLPYGDEQAYQEFIQSGKKRSTEGVAQSEA